MTFRFILAALALLLLAGPLRAQTPLGQPSLDESKVQIWCATVRFVYDDAGRPNLKSTVRCEGGNLDALVASIRPDSLRVYSLLYQPIEGRGAIYQGKKDNPTRLAALAKAIVSKLKGSPARRKDPARMARVAALETALTNYVTSGTPLGEVSAAMAPEKPDTTAVPGAPGPAEAAEAQAAAERDAARPGGTALPTAGSGSLLFRFAAPLSLILSILSLVLYIMLRITLGHWRRQQRRETLTAKQAATTAQAAAAETSAAVADSVARVKRAEALVLAASETSAPSVATPALNQLSPAQRLEVERLVSQRVDEELRWLRANLPELVAAAVAPAAATETPPSSASKAEHGEPAGDDV
ncbi:hypothetical protein [Hymenobacter properus]|uniref:Uncharacterized protein n=1 Tax=Hymenobacter properus TaxID=2791026 RepID=A0A931BFC8_9BACT|nr:hypothetical protein [Hymenobacter properus]MBF9141257.1 hypothetical protein [Hymenobacter properus]MBR7720067.1 hypothetical protein [Microvirga sp. SRT04]